MAVDRAAVEQVLARVGKVEQEARADDVDEDDDPGEDRVRLDHAAVACDRAEESAQQKKDVRMTVQRACRRKYDVPDQREERDGGVNAGCYAHGYSPSRVNVAVVDVLPCLPRQDDCAENFESCAFGEKKWGYSRCKTYHRIPATNPVARNCSRENRKTPARTGIQQQKCLDMLVAGRSVGFVKE